MTWGSCVLGYLRPLTKIAGLLALAAMVLLAGCTGASESSADDVSPVVLQGARPTIERVDPPALIGELEPWLDSYAPQIAIRQPSADQVFDDTTVDVILGVQDLPIYKDKVWDLGPHVDLLLDNQPYGSIYDSEQPIVLRDLTPGTHTLRAFAVRPWNESFKNEGAYAQVTFHIFAKTDENSPVADRPLLTYGAPMGTYGAEPILLDFYLIDAPLHQVAQDNPLISDWRVRYTLNGDSLTLNNWESLYVKGLNPGRNWVQLTLVDDEGEPIEGVFNNTVRLITYDPDLNNSLAKIVRGDLTLAEVGGIVDPTYQPPIPEPTEPTQPESTQPTKPEPTQPEPTQPTEPEPPEAPPAPTVTGVPEAAPPRLAKPEVDKIEPGTAEPADEISPPPDSARPDPAPENKAAESEAPAPDAGSPKTDSFENAAILEETATLEETAEMPVQSDAIAQPKASTQSEPGVFNSSDDSSGTTPDSPAGVSPAPGEPMDEIPLDPASESSGADLESQSKRRYFQRLYDYRDRSMQTYGRDRN
ncbi:MAG: hypothetical protein AAF282_21915 [Cyanobacteria bacterium P01_A01_bin.15]